jgi:Holliday junction resolvase RusA-like endonuclease
MPESWAQKKKDSLAGTLHQQTPDTDNIGKGIKDSLLEEDKTICVDLYFKFWCHEDEEPRVDVFILRLPHTL